MDTTDTPDTPAPTAALAPRGSQSRLSAALFFVLLAALLFRVVTAVMDRNARPEPARAPGDAPPLVRWVAADKAAALSASSGKPALYDFTAAWCAPCHRLDAEGWGDEELADLANHAFVPARVMDRSREDGKNAAPVDELQNKYRVEAFPTLIAAGADGKELARMEGWAGRDALEQFLKDAQTKAKRR